MFEFAAIIGFNIDRKPNWDLIIKGDYQVELIQIFPEKLRASQQIQGTLLKCFPNNKLCIFNEENIQLYPKEEQKKTNNILKPQLHKFEFPLQDGTSRYIYCICFYEQAYLQNVTSLTGQRERVITWNEQIDIQDMLNSRNPVKQLIFNNQLKIYVQKTIVISCKQEDIGCEATFMSYICTYLRADQKKIDDLKIKYIQEIEQKGYQGLQNNYLEELLSIIKISLKQHKIDNISLGALIEYLNSNHKEIQIAVEPQELDEIKQPIQIPYKLIVKRNEMNQDSSKVLQELYEINKIDHDTLYMPKKQPQMKRISKSSQIISPVGSKVNQNNFRSPYQQAPQSTPQQTAQPFKKEAEFNSTAQIQQQNVMEFSFHSEKKQKAKKGIFDKEQSMKLISFKRM